MITSNILQRVFLVSVASKSCTAFAIEHSGKQYLVTVRHIFPNLRQKMDISIFHDKRWRQLSTTLVGAENDADIVVLASPKQLAPAYPAEPSMEMVLAQQVFFLGFPLELTGGGEEINRNFPLPLVKTGIVSGFDFAPASKFWIDGHNNPGFSGGPVVFIPHELKQNGSAEYKIAGVKWILVVARKSLRQLKPRNWIYRREFRDNSRSWHQACG